MSKLIHLRNDCYIDLDRAILVKDGLPCSLTPTETRLLQTLATNPGHIVTYNRLLNELQTYQPHLTRHELHVYVSRLRKKFDTKLDIQNFILVVKGVGYLLITEGLNRL
ncbi:winged helix-turn-helix domain-containing protein [Paenibacillus durus]|uniref:winged helix-turn-helix domain-containing protein n=1 Tax=Paenibacillus durus TaxID=44251 RepID=UPI00046FCC5B